MSASQCQEFCVRWNSHLGSIGAAFPQLLAGQRFVDVTLACEGHQVHCHRLVLAACSSYFESILAENPCKHPVIILPSEVKLWEIQALVDFMYKGEVNVTQAGLPSLLRCAEQLRIRGLYGSDAALNLNQLKALTSKVTAVTTSTGNATNDSTETDDTATNSTTTTSTTAPSVLQQTQSQSQQSRLRAAVTAQEQIIKKEIIQQQQTNGTNASRLHQQQLQQQQIQQQQLQQQLQQQQQQQFDAHHHNKQTAPKVHSNAPTEDDSADDSTSNAYDQYEDVKPQLMHLDSTVEEDHNYVAHDEDDSFGGTAADTEHETSANSSTLLPLDALHSYKRVRRSEASLAQAAKCVSKGQTFQTVSNMFNIPVSTIRFYMARKGILPKRKRGRGASTASAGATSSLASAVMSQALAQMKRSGSPTMPLETPYHMVGYKLNEQGAAHMI